MQHLKEIIDLFWEHQYIAHHQQDEFDRSIANLPEDQILILEDFAMSYSHIHNGETQGEHWEHWSTTLFNTIVYAHRDNPEDMKAGRGVWATAEPFVSADRKHSNEFVRYCNEILISKWLTKNPKLKAVHIWSDGCKGQFKQKKQWHWLSEAAAEHGIRITHNFFQSCHGKGPADGEGAVYKRGMRQAELFGEYMQTSKEAFEWLQKHRSKLQQRRKHKGAHSIHSRCFHFVDLGAVKQKSSLIVKGGAGSAARFRFGSAEKGQVLMGLLSCFCDSCFKGEYGSCKEKHTAFERVRCVAEKGVGVAIRKQAAEAYINKRAQELLKELKEGMDVLVYKKGLCLDQLLALQAMVSEPPP
jgi:hypothetical protein